MISNPGIGAKLAAGIVVAVGNYFQATGNQVVMDIALIIHFLFFEITDRKPPFHLLEAPVMHLRRVDMYTGHFTV